MGERKQTIYDGCDMIKRLFEHRGSLTERERGGDREKKRELEGERVG